MSNLLLPAQINPPTIRKDGSVSLKFDSRELNSEEYMMIMGFRNLEGWLMFAPNKEQLPEVPTTRAELEQKTPGERLYGVLYRWYMQETEKGRFTGLFETFRNEKMEVIIQGVKKKLE